MSCLTFENIILLSHTHIDIWFWIKNIKKWFGAWYTSICFIMWEYSPPWGRIFCNLGYITTWERYGGPHFTHYFVSGCTELQIVFILTWGNYAPWYMLELQFVPFSLIWDGALGQWRSTPSTCSSHNHNVHSWLQSLSTKFLNINNHRTPIM